MRNPIDKILQNVIQSPRDRITGQAQARKAVQTLERGARWFCLLSNYPGRMGFLWRKLFLLSATLDSLLLVYA